MEKINKYLKDDKLILSLVIEMFSSLRDLTEEEKICDRFLERIAFHFKIKKAAIFLKNTTSDIFYYTSGIGINYQKIAKKDFSIYHSGFFAIFNMQVPIKIDDVSPADVEEFPFLEGATAALVLPIYNEKSTLGFVFFVKVKKEEGIFTDFEKSLLTLLINQISPIIDLQMTFKELQISKSKLTEMYENLKHFDEIKNSFLYNITHELKTPLVNIIGYSEILKTKDIGDLNAIQTKSVDTVLKNAQNLLKTIDELLMFVNLTDKINNINVYKVDLMHIVHSCLENKHYEKAPIKLENNREKVFIDADPYLIEKALEQMLENAIKFNRNNNPIAVSVFCTEDNFVLCTVTDQGIGIDEESMQQIFKMFYQESKNMNRKYGGLGFGIALINKIINVHKFELLLESTKGLGTKIGFKARTVS